MSSSMDSVLKCRVESGGQSTCELEQNLNLLRHITAFSGVPIDRLKLCAYMSKRVRFKAGDFLFRQGSPDDSAYILISGRVQVIREYKDRSVIVNEFQEGEFFGGLALLTEIKRPFSARAAADTVCLALDRESFRRVFSQFPEVVIKLMDSMLKRVLGMMDKLIEQLSAESTIDISI